MGIGNISDYGNLLQNYRIPSIPEVSVKEAAAQNTPKENNPVLNTPAVSKEQPSYVRRPSEEMKLEDVSLSLGGNEPFEMIGRDSKLEKLDIEAAVSDMKKDSILEQYQFFVGSSQNILENSMEPDGIVIAKL